MIFLVSGCGQATPVTHDPSSVSYLYGIVWNHHIYDVNRKGIEAAGNQLGSVTKYAKTTLNPQDNGTVSNEFSVGTRIYTVPNKDSSSAIAIETAKGQYIEIEVDPQSNN